MPDAVSSPLSAGSSVPDTASDEASATGCPRQIDLDGGSPTNGLAQLVLTLVKLLHDLLEKQAIRRMESGRLTDKEVERVGQTLKRQAEELDYLCEVFGLDQSDLDLNLGSVQGLDASDLE